MTSRCGSKGRDTGVQIQRAGTDHPGRMLVRRLPSTSRTGPALARDTLLRTRTNARSGAHPLRTNPWRAADDETSRRCGPATGSLMSDERLQFGARRTRSRTAHGLHDLRLPRRNRTRRAGCEQADREPKGPPSISASGPTTTTLDPRRTPRRNEERTGRGPPPRRGRRRAVVRVRRSSRPEEQCHPSVPSARPSPEGSPRTAGTASGRPASLRAERPRQPDERDPTGVRLTETEPGG
jgi:hypothetical protein